jgi:TRAP-type C4-dicarboxylate transport system substrate-binding protein
MGKLNQLGGENGEFVTGTEFGGGNLSSSKPYKRRKKMKKASLIVLAVVLAVSMVVLAWSAPASAREKIQLDFATFWPAGDFQAAIGHKNWMKTIADRVKAETDYEIEWTEFYGVHPAKLLDGLEAGTYDVGTSGPGYSPGVFPLWAGPQYPGEAYRKNAYTMSLTIQALNDQMPELQAQFDRTKMKLMHFWSTGPGYFLMTPGNNIRTLADFSGKTIRAANPPSVECIEALGAKALFAPMSVALERFEAKLIDGILCPTDTPKGFGLGAYVRHVIFAPFSYHFVFFKVMNKDTYDRLPAKVKTIFDEVNAAYPAYYGQLRTWGEKDGLEYMKGLEGYTYYDPRAENPTEYAKWVGATAGLIDKWIGGDATKKAVWNKFLELDKYYSTTPPYSTWADSWPTEPAPPSFKK